MRYVWTPALARIWNGPRHQPIDGVQYYERVSLKNDLHVVEL